MKITVKRMLALLFVALCLWGTVGCGRYTADAESHLRAYQKDGRLPHGVWYQSGKQVWEDGYLSPLLLQKWLGVAELPADAWYAFWGEDDEMPCEVFIADCYTHTAASEVAALCAARLAFLQANGIDTAAFAEAAVKQQGKTVLYTVIP